MLYINPQCFDYFSRNDGALQVINLIRKEKTEGVQNDKHLARAPRTYIPSISTNALPDCQSRRTPQEKTQPLEAHP